MAALKREAIPALEFLRALPADVLFTLDDCTTLIGRISTSNFSYRLVELIKNGNMTRKQREKRVDHNRVDYFWTVAQKEAVILSIEQPGVVHARSDSGLFEKFMRA